MKTHDPRGLALRAALALPGPVLRALAGGPAVHVGGRTLDPRVQFLAAQTRASPRLSAQTPEEARTRAAEAGTLLRGAPPPGVAVERLSTPGGAGAVAARAYRPHELTPGAPLMIFAHGGGGVTGNLETADGFCGLFAAVAGWPVVSIDYRLAPESRFPAALEDMLATCAWARETASDYGAAEGSIAVGGESFGGNLAAAACQSLRDLGAAQPVLQLLLYPLLDAAGDQPSLKTYGRAWPLSSDDITWFTGHYLNPTDTPDDPRVSPLRAADVSALAPALIACAGFDPLLDQGEAYARKLAAARTAVTYRCYDSLAHGFAAFIDVVPAAAAACLQIAGLARDLVLNETA